MTAPTTIFLAVPVAKALDFSAAKASMDLSLALPRRDTSLADLGVGTVPGSK